MTAASKESGAQLDDPYDQVSGLSHYGIEPSLLQGRATSFYEFETGPTNQTFTPPWEGSDALLDLYEHPHGVYNAYGQPDHESGINGLMTADPAYDATAYNSADSFNTDSQVWMPDQGSESIGQATAEQDLWGTSLLGQDDLAFGQQSLVRASESGGSHGQYSTFLRYYIQRIC